MFVLLLFIQREREREMATERERERERCQQLCAMLACSTLRQVAVTGVAENEREAHYFHWMIEIDGESLKVKINTAFMNMKTSPL